MNSRFEIKHLSIDQLKRKIEANNYSVKVLFNNLERLWKTINSNDDKVCIISRTISQPGGYHQFLLDTWKEFEVIGSFTIMSDIVFSNISYCYYGRKLCLAKDRLQIDHFSKKIIKIYARINLIREYQKKLNGF